MRLSPATPALPSPTPMPTPTPSSQSTPSPRSPRYSISPPRFGPCSPRHWFSAASLPLPPAHSPTFAHFRGPPGYFPVFAPAPPAMYPHGISPLAAMFPSPALAPSVQAATALQDRLSDLIASNALDEAWQLYVVALEHKLCPPARELFFALLAKRNGERVAEAIALAEEHGQPLLSNDLSALLWELCERNEAREAKILFDIVRRHSLLASEPTYSALLAAVSRAALLHSDADKQLQRDDREWLDVVAVWQAVKEDLGACHIEAMAIAIEVAYRYGHSEMAWALFEGLGQGNETHTTGLGAGHLSRLIELFCWARQEDRLEAVFWSSQQSGQILTCPAYRALILVASHAGRLTLAIEAVDAMLAAGHPLDGNLVGPLADAAEKAGDETSVAAIGQDPRFQAVLLERHVRASRKQVRKRLGDRAPLSPVSSEAHDGAGLDTTLRAIAAIGKEFSLADRAGL